MAKTVEEAQKLTDVGFEYVAILVLMENYSADESGKYEHYLKVKCYYGVML